MNLKTPRELAALMASRITPVQRAAAISTWLTGFLCHIFIYTNSMYNNDDIRYLYVDFDKPELGRWLQTYAAGISSYFSLPVVNGLLALFYTGLSAAVIVTLFRLSSRLNAALVGALLVTFPTMASLNSFVFATDPFMLSCLLSCLAAYCTCALTGKKSCLAAILCLCSSVGIYQAYLPFTLLLMLLYYILQLTDVHVDTRSLVRLGLRYILVLVLGMFSYYIGMEATLKLKSVDLRGYQGIGESSLPGPSQLVSRLHTALLDFRDFFRGNQVLALNAWLKAGLIITLLLMLVSLILLLMRSGAWKDPIRMLLVVFCCLCTPPAVNVIYLISDGVVFHILMRHAWCLLFIAAIVLVEKVCDNPAAPSVSLQHSLSVACRGESEAIACAGHKGWSLVLQWASLAAALVIIWNYILLSNIAYFNMNFRYEKTYALCLQIRDKMLESEDYDRHRPVAFVGKYSKTYKMDPVSQLLDPLAGMKGERVFAEGSRNYVEFFHNMLGEDIEVVTPEREEAFRSDPRFMEMPRFPADGSIRVIDDITVIKLND